MSFCSTDGSALPSKGPETPVSNCHKKRVSRPVSMHNGACREVSAWACRCSIGLGMLLKTDTCRQEHESSHIYGYSIGWVSFKVVRSCSASACSVMTFKSHRNAHISSKATLCRMSWKSAQFTSSMSLILSSTIDLMLSELSQPAEPNYSHPNAGQPTNPEPGVQEAVGLLAHV